MNFSEFEGKVFETDDINEHRLEPELKKIKGYGEALVYGDPYGIARKLDGHQGDNIYNLKNNDGLMAVLNVLRMAGVNCSENGIVRYAIKNNFCNHAYFGFQDEEGRTLPFGRSGLLEHYGISSKVLFSNFPGGDLESIAGYVESGRGVIMEVDSDLLSLLLYEKIEDQMVRLPLADRCVTVTGTARDPETGSLKGFFVCDTKKEGFGNKSVFVPLDILQNVYGYTGGIHDNHIYGANVVVTDKPIR